MKDPVRQCIVCRNHYPKKAMLRVAKTPEGQIVFDERQISDGRGAYCCANENCLEKARKRNVFSGYFQHKTTPEIYLKMARALYVNNDEKLSALLGFAVKARHAVTGTTGVEADVRRGKIKFIIIDSSAGKTTVEKMTRLAEQLKLFLYFLPESLSLEKITGKDKCKVAGIAKGNFAESLIRLLKPVN